MVKQEKIKVIAKKKLGKQYFQLTFYSPHIARTALPGQFVEVKVSDSDIPLLRRPLGVHKTGKQTFDVLCEVVGEGTKILSRVNPGEYLDVIGPLGNGFNVRQSGVIVAGGMGVAPLIFLAEKLREISNPKSQIPNLVLIGAKSKRQILCEKEFRKLECSVKIATDDGSAGFKGRVTDLLRHLLRAKSYELRANIYACGPKPMLKEVSLLSQEFKVPAQISLEAHMACGFGACLGCVVDTIDGFKRVCKDGPVFKADEIIWKKACLPAGREGQ